VGSCLWAGDGWLGRDWWGGGRGLFCGWGGVGRGGVCRGGGGECRPLPSAVAYGVVLAYRTEGLAAVLAGGGPGRVSEGLLHSS